MTRTVSLLGTVAAIFYVILAGASGSTSEGGGSHETSREIEARSLVPEGIEASAPSWSADSSMLTVGGEAGGILVVPLRAGSPRALTADPYHNGPVWDPTGRLIVFGDDSADDPKPIYVIDPRKEHAVPRKLLAKRETYLAGAPWSPDGRRLLYWTGSGEVGSIDVESGARHVIEPAKTSGTPIAFSDLRWTGSGAIVGVRGGHVVIRRSGESTWQVLDENTGSHPAEGLAGQLWWIAGRDRSMLYRYDGQRTSSISLGGIISSFDINQRTGSIIAAVYGRGLVLVDPSGQVVALRTSGCGSPPDAIALKPPNTSGNPKFDLYPTNGLPVWSPDGTEIAFVRLTGASAAPLLCVSAPDGTIR